MSTKSQQKNTPTNLAARHRPDGFDVLTGQRHVAAVLRPAIVHGNVPQQLLFSGGSGLGKTTVARIVASAVLCLTPMELRSAGDPCRRCASCDAMAKDQHPDYIEFDAASHGGKDEIREIAARAQTSPLLSTKRVYVIDEAHGLSAAGGQAFLKLLEEPPAHVLFMLCTTDPEKMLRTNRGRCTELELRRPSNSELVANLKRVCQVEGWQVDDELLSLLVETSDPELGVRGTVNVLQKLGSQLTAGPMNREQICELLGLAPDKKIEELLRTLRGESSDMFRALEALRRGSSEEAIRAALLRWLRSEIVVPTQLPDRIAGANLLEMLLRSAQDPAWLDLFMVRASEISTYSSHASANSSTANTPAGSSVANAAIGKPAAASMSGQADKRAGNRNDIQSEVRSNKTSAPAAKQDNPQASSPNDNTTKPSDQVLVAHNVSAHATHSAEAAAFIAAIHRTDPDLGNALSLCTVTVGENVDIHTTGELHGKVELGMRVLRLAAGRAGLGVTLHASESA